jgi:uncharacterized protein (DUF1697 family)
MARYAAFLRGINVGGRKATSDQLRACFEALGFEDVATFRASGNVVFTTESKTDAKKIEQALRKTLGYDSAAFVRTQRELVAIANHDPFPPRVVDRSKGKLQVVLLRGKPTAAVGKRVRALQTDDDLLTVRGQELYWLPSSGLMDSDIGMEGITNVVGPNTMRTKGTIEQLVAKYFG